MKPQTITSESLPVHQIAAVIDWLKSNGVRHFIPADARIIITGNMIITPTFDIGRTYNPRYGYNRRAGTLAMRTRRYRIRHELRLDGTK
jgi:hypothetical protein